MHQSHPRFPEFEYYQPKSSKEAVDFLRKHANQSRPFAGGTDCLNQIRDKKNLPRYLVDLKAIEDYKKINFDPTTGLTIGAAVSLNQIISDPHISEVYPLLSDSSQEVGGYQLRNRATLVGNLCNASPCGDTIGACLVYSGILTIVGPDNQRIVELKDFFEGPGKTILRPDEIVACISFPIPPSGARGSYQSIGRNKVGDLAIAAVTVLGYDNRDSLSGYEFLITLTAVAPIVKFATSAQELLKLKPINKNLLVEASSSCANESRPINDIRSSAQYRKDMIQMLAFRGLTMTCDLLNLTF